MEVEVEDEYPLALAVGVGVGSHLVTLPFSCSNPNPNPRRLSSRFAKPSSPVPCSRNKPSWISRLVGVDQATSSRAIGGSFTPQQALAWDLFSPFHRLLIVAVVAAATANNRHILRLQDSVRHRDQILMSMQQKLDNLCHQMTCFKDQPLATADSPAPKIVDFPSTQPSFPTHSHSLSLSLSLSTDCWLCDQHRPQLNDFSGNAFVKADEMFRSRLSVSNEAEQEERRMSDLSDWAASSVTSAADLQLNNLASEQDTYNLKKECEEKDAAIKELSAFIRSNDSATSKRIEDLEEIIRRKSTIITKLRKDMIVLEQKVVSLTRMRRRSYSGSETEKKQLPTMMDNLIYDMDSPTSPLSSDSDCSSEKQHVGISSVKSEEINSVSTTVQHSFTYEDENMTKRHRQSAPPKISTSSIKRSSLIPRSRPVSPLKEKSMNQGHSSIASLRLNQVPASAGPRNSRRRTQNVSKETAPSKRWM